MGVRAERGRLGKPLQTDDEYVPAGGPGCSRNLPRKRPAACYNAESALHYTLPVMGEPRPCASPEDHPAISQRPAGRRLLTNSCGEVGT